jgi:hypothetical protein
MKEYAHHKRDAILVGIVLMIVASGLIYIDSTHSPYAYKGLTTGTSSRPVTPADLK